MNKQESDVLKIIYEEPGLNQRLLSERSGHSLGVVNRSVNVLLSEGYITDERILTEKAKKEFDEKRPQRAIILAAGFGMRMVPINLETPKAFLKVNGEVLIERQIRQLQEAGIKEIYVVVGFLKEQFEYLIDDFGVKLIVNSEYATKGNIYSLKLAEKYLENAYIVPCDIWCDSNPFCERELYSWYMVSDLIDDDSEVRVNRKSELVKVVKGKSGNTMVGISYLLKEDAKKLKENLDKLADDEKYEEAFWEEALYKNDRMIIPAKVVNSESFVEINTYEQLRDLDNNSVHLRSDAIMTIQKALNVKNDDIVDITVLKKGMTNRSFMFTCKGEKYIMRIPGEGTDQLINRKEEADVYRVIGDKDICDQIMYMNPENGYKITKYIEGARVCDAFNEDDLLKCMDRLRKFHGLKLKVGHVFDLYEKIDFYESLWEGHPSVYRDYEKTKKNVLSLKSYIDEHKQEMYLTHIDAVADNFLFSTDKDGKEHLNLIDWEYAAMQDQHVDIAMFCIYAMYDKEQVDHLIDIYFEGNCSKENRIKIYCYIATSGLLWSNWCEYKRNLGVEFGEYSLRQYRYAKEFYRYVMEELGE